MGCIRTTCRSMIVMINTLVLLLSIALVGVSIFLVVKEYTGSPIIRFPDTPVGDLSALFVWVPFVLSIIIMFISLAGCCTALEEKKCCVGFYGVLQFVFGLIFVFVGVFFVLYGETFTKLGTVRNPLIFNKDPSNIKSMSLRFFSDLTTGVYVNCCNGGQPSNCSSIIPGGDSCPVGLENSCYCVFSEAVFEKGENAPKDFCTFLSSAGATCGSNESEDTDPSRDLTRLKDYQTAMARSINKTIFPAGIGLASFGSMLFIVSFGSWYIACCARSRKPAY